MSVKTVNSKSFFRKYIRPCVPFPKRRTLLRWFPSFETRNVAFILKNNGVDTLIDVGANIGQFATKMRSAGYRGRIVSFEPILAVHKQLSRLAARDPDWHVAQCMALGAQEGTATINVMADHSLSSLLTANDLHPIRHERVPIKPLDNALVNCGIPDNSTLALKVDVQGYEPQVFEGATQTLAKCKAVFIEVSLRSVYAGELNYLDMLTWLRDRGFHAVYFAPVLNRQKLGEMWQMDVLLLRRE